MSAVVHKPLDEVATYLPCTGTKTCCCLEYARTVGSRSCSDQPLEHWLCQLHAPHPSITCLIHSLGPDSTHSSKQAAHSQMSAFVRKSQVACLPSWSMRSPALRVSASDHGRITISDQHQCNTLVSITFGLPSKKSWHGSVLVGDHHSFTVSLHPVTMSLCAESMLNEIYSC
jgi:hypothetical protein